MALNRLQYDLLDKTNELDMLGNLYYVEYIQIEADANGASITPTLQLATTDIALSSQSNEARGFLEFPVNRIGPINRLEVSPVAGINWYQVEVFVRLIEFRIHTVPSGNTTAFSGRTNDISSNVVFDVQPFAPTEDPRVAFPVIRRLYIDAETGTSSFTPVLTFDDGATQSLAVVDTVGRAITEYSIIGAKRLASLELTGDFSADQIVLYGVSADLYIPGKRRMSIG